MTCLPLIMNGTASQGGGGGGGGGGLTATITAGQSAVAAKPFHDFGNNTCVASGGSGVYVSFTWAFAKVVPADGTVWSSGSGATLDVTVTNAAGVDTSAAYYCTVTDNAGHTAVSNAALYRFISTL